MREVVELEEREITFQPGFQEKVLSCTADIAICGGSAGGGKTWSLLMEALRHIDDPKFGAVYFRHLMKSIKGQGGLWDESKIWCPLFGGDANETNLKWKFASGAQIKFEGIEYDQDLANYMGLQIPLIIFDELTEFTQKMFTFMISRNRGLCSIKPYIRASCNPDPDSWVASFLEWWIDQDTGYPIPERDGVLRYMINWKDQIVWGNSKEEIIEKVPEAFRDERFVASGIDKTALIKSVTFIHGDVYQNKILLSNDPGYLGSLNSMNEADQARFLNGNWKVRADGMGIYDNSALEKIFVEYEYEIPEIQIGWSRGQPVKQLVNDYSNNFITCDAAKFGRDLCIIAVWKGWTIVHLTIFQTSTVKEIKDEIELLRVEFGVPRRNALVDQDGVGGDVVKLGGYYGFMARREAAIDPDSRVKENYKSRKDQCYYRSAARVFREELKIHILTSSIKIYYTGSKKPMESVKMKWNGDYKEIKSIILSQLRAIKRGMSDFEGGLIKLCCNSKEEQKEILDGASPDFADVIMMREDFELMRGNKGSKKMKKH